MKHKKKPIRKHRKVSWMIKYNIGCNIFHKLSTKQTEYNVFSENDSLSIKSGLTTMKLPFDSINSQAQLSKLGVFSLKKMIAHICVQNKAETNASCLGNRIPTIVLLKP